MFVVHHEHEKLLLADETVEIEQVHVKVEIDGIGEHDEIDEIEQIDDKLFIFIKNEHQNRFLLMVEHDENDDAENIIVQLIALIVEQIEQIDVLEQIDGNVFIK